MQAKNHSIIFCTMYFQINKIFSWIFYILFRVICIYIFLVRIVFSQLILSRQTLNIWTCVSLTEYQFSIEMYSLLKLLVPIVSLVEHKSFFNTIQTLILIIVFLSIINIEKTKIQYMLITVLKYDLWPINLYWFSGFHVALKL